MGWHSSASIQVISFWRMAEQLYTGNAGDMLGKALGYVWMFRTLSLHWRTLTPAPSLLVLGIQHREHLRLRGRQEDK